MTDDDFIREKMSGKFKVCRDIAESVFSEADQLRVHSSVREKGSI